MDEPVALIRKDISQRPTFAPVVGREKVPLRCSTGRQGAKTGANMGRTWACENQALAAASGMGTTVGEAEG